MHMPWGDRARDGGRRAWVLKVKKSRKNRSKSAPKDAWPARKTRENFQHMGFFGDETCEKWAFFTLALVVLKFFRIGLQFERFE